jgi:hypothetical protein
VASCSNRNLLIRILAGNSDVQPSSENKEPQTAYQLRHDHDELCGRSFVVRPMWRFVAAIYYVYPSLNILYFLLGSLVSACALQTLSSEVKNQHPRQQVMLMFMLRVPCEYVCVTGLNKPSIQYSSFYIDIYQIIQALLLLVYSFTSTTLVVNHDETVSYCLLQSTFSRF